jgi:hypothetical protein
MTPISHEKCDTHSDYVAAEVLQENQAKNAGLEEAAKLSKSAPAELSWEFDELREKVTFKRGVEVVSEKTVD